MHTCTLGNNKHRFFECASKQASQPANQLVSQPASRLVCRAFAKLKRDPSSPGHYAPATIRTTLCTSFDSRKWRALQSTVLCLLSRDLRYLNAVYAPRIHRSPRSLHARSRHSIANPTIPQSVRLLFTVIERPPDFSLSASSFDHSRKKGPRKISLAGEDVDEGSYFTRTRGKITRCVRARKRRVGLSYSRRGAAG